MTYAMKFTFKLVYTDIIYETEILSNATLEQLFNNVSNHFSNFICLDKYYIDFVVAGQPKCELATAIGAHSYDDTLNYEFGDNWKQVSFYVRPMNRLTSSFVRLDCYNEYSSSSDLDLPPVPPQNEILLND